MNKTIALSLTGILTLVSTSVLADHGWRDRDDGYYDRARVLQVEPITTIVQVAVPQQECYRQEVHTPVYTRHNDGAAVVGGVVGSIIGHNISHGRGGGTIAGAIIGAAVGRSMSQGTDSYYDEVSYVDRCEVHTRYQTQERLEGYRVTYRYRGQIYTTRTDYDPGKFIQVRVDVSPVDE